MSTSLKDPGDERKTATVVGSISILAPLDPI